MTSVQTCSVSKCSCNNR